MFIPFEYHDPKTLAEFIALSEKLEKYQILAGGTDLFVKMRNGWKPSPHIIDIKKITDIPGISKIEKQNNGINIGALVNFTQLKDNALVKKNFSAMYDAAKVMGCYEIRNRATVGGNICNAASGAEAGCTMLVFDAVVHIAGKNGNRQVPLSKFYKVTEKQRPAIDLQQGELVTHFFVPDLPEDSHSAYVRRTRTKGMDLANLNLAAVVSGKNKPSCLRVRIAAGTVYPVPRRFPEVEQVLDGQAISAELIEQVKSLLAEHSKPRASSKRAAPDYKKDQIGHLFALAMSKMAIH